MNIIETIRAEIKRLIRINQTKNGFPAGTFCAIRIEAYEHLLAFLDTLQEQKPVDGLEEAAHKFALLYDYGTCDGIAQDCFIAGAEWGASHAVAPHYFELRELKTGRVFLAEWSDMAGEWYEHGNGRAHQSDEVEIVQRDKKTPTP